MSRGFETRCLHLEETEGKYDNYGAISYPIYQTATYARPAVGQSTGYDYSRLQNPTRDMLERMVCQLENGVDAFALSTGMAAITFMMELFKPGDHILADANLYGGSIRLFDNISSKNGLKVTRTDFWQGEYEKLIEPDTKALYIETPTNPMMNVTDIAAAAKIAHEHNALLIVDNTFLSPYLQNPLDLGADIVIHSGTKFLGGHNDTLAGFVIVKDYELKERLRFLIKTTGAGLAPFDCWLMLRGIKTLPLRMERAQENALKIVAWLEKQSKVKHIYYPGLASHPGYEIMKRQARGFGSMLSFELYSKAAAITVLENVRLIKFAESLGGTETLITYPTTQTHADVPKEIKEQCGITEALLRLSVGIESAQDLLNELERVFELI